MMDKEPIQAIVEQKKKLKVGWKVAGTVSGIILIVILCIIIYRRYYVGNRPLTDDGSSGGIKFNLKPVLEKKKIASPINGEIIDEDLASKYPLAIMIENHPDARPQSGLGRADAVYEAITEGGITRFMAIYGSKSATEIGPVRSARTFFVDWASEYSAYYAHAGGAPDALALIPKSNVYDIPHTQGYFERKDRGNVASEHTLFSSTDNLYRLAGVKKYPTSQNVSKLEYKDDNKLEDRGEPKTTIINFSTESYIVSWTFNKEQNIYSRNLAGVPHKDNINSEQITSKVIVVQEVARQPIQLPGAKPSFKFSTISSGKATIYQDGKETSGTWKKIDQNTRTKFYDQNGIEVKFNRGTCWYEIVPPGTSVISN